MRKPRTALTSLLLLSLMLVGGCEDTTGGGQLPSTGDPDAKASFGFSLHCEDTLDDSGDQLALLTGNFEYRDHGYWIVDESGRERQLSIHGKVDAGVFFATCAVLDEAGMEAFGSEGYVGEFHFQPRHSGEPGVFQVLFEDNGQRGASKEDRITIRLYENADSFGGTPLYENAGLVTNGQLTQHFD